MLDIDLTGRELTGKDAIPEVGAERCAVLRGHELLGAFVARTATPGNRSTNGIAPNQ